MYTEILCKVLAEDAESAISYVRSELEDTCREGIFDYVDEDIKVITKKDLNGGTFEDLEKEYNEQAGDSEIARAKGALKDDIRNILLSKVIPQEDLPTMINLKNAFGHPDVDAQEIVEQRLKEGKKDQSGYPDNPDKLLDLIMNLVDNITSPESGMLFQLKTIREVRACREYSTDKYTCLNTVHNSYADLTEDTDGMGDTYYVLASRHV